MSCSFVAVSSGAGAWPGFTTVLWLTEQPERPAPTAAARTQVNARKLNRFAPREQKVQSSSRFQGCQRSVTERKHPDCDSRRAATACLKVYCASVTLPFTNVTFRSLYT